MALWPFLLDLVLLLGAAFVLGALAQRLRQSPIIGYLLAGTIIGPLLFNPQAVNQTAELGVALLLFSIGLEFSFSRLRSMGRMALGGGTLQVLGTLGVVAVLAATQTSLAQALAIGAIVALSSTAVVMRVLVDRAEIDSVRGRSCLAILLLQDIAIVPLVIMVSLLIPGPDVTISLHILKIAAAAVSLGVLLYLLLYKVAPVLLATKGVFANRELSVLLAITVGLGATWAAHRMGISPALGAFVAGMLLGESPFATQIQADIGTLRTIMVTLFFASIGMLAKPAFFLTHGHWILLAAVLIFVLKTGLTYAVTSAFGLDHRHALATGISLGQIGEFSFVLAASARRGGLFSETLFELIISTIIILMFAAPYMVAWAFPLVNCLSPRPSGDGSPMDGAGHGPAKVLVVGFGPAGRQVVEHMREHGIDPTIIDVNPLSRAEALQMGLTLHLGDATNEDILRHAGVADICMGIVTVPDPFASVLIVKALRRLRPHLPIAARCRYNRHLKDLEGAGADIVVDEETCIGQLLSRNVITYLQNAADSAAACRLVHARPQDIDPVECPPPSRNGDLS